MYLARYRCLDESFLIYAHVVASDSDEVRRFAAMRCASTTSSDRARGSMRRVDACHRQW